MYQRTDVYLGFFTWVGVIMLTLNGWINPVTTMPDFTAANLIQASVLFLVFIFCYLLIDARLPFKVTNQLRLYLIALATTTVLALSQFFYFGYVAILAIIIVSQLPELIKTRYSICYALIIPIVGGFIDGFIKEAPAPLITTLLFIMFNLFALLASHRFVSERKAKEKSKQLVRELEATQLLLSAATKRDERLRIARDLHDVVGHHLTALGLQLEVAMHVDKEPAKEHIKQAKDISTLLLADVRNAVSEIRESIPMDLAKALKTLTKDVPGLNVNLDVNLEAPLSDARQVEALFRSVQEALTNTIKHANASELEIIVSNCHKWVTTKIKDNGDFVPNFSQGNGLKGMQERLEKLDGQLSYQSTQNGFSLNLQLPNLASVNGIHS